MFCDSPINDSSFLLGFPLYIISWTLSCVFLFKVFSGTPIVGSIWTILVVICYIKFTLGELFSLHIVHGIIATVPIVAMVWFVIYAMKKEAEDEKIRQNEINLLPQRIADYINENRFTSPSAFIAFFNENADYKTAQSVQYSNPLYEKAVNENKKRKENNLEPLPITVPAQINYGEFASFKYKETVLTYFMKELPAVLNSIYMFDHDNIYESMPDYAYFFQNENGVVDTIYFQQACIGMINEMLRNGTIVRVGGGKNLYKSTVISEDEGNIVEGETIEMSFDD